MTQQTVRNIVSCLPRMGRALVTPAACDSSITTYNACGFVQRSNSSGIGPDLGIYDPESDSFVLDVDAILKFIRNCTSTIPRRIFSFYYDTPSPYPARTISLNVGGADETDAQEIGSAFQTRMVQHFRFDPDSNSTSFSGVWIGLIILGAFIVLGIALFGYCRRKKSGENSLLLPNQNQSRDAIKLRRAIKNFQARSYGGSISISSASVSLIDSRIETTVPTSYPDIMDAVESVFKRSNIESFYLSDSGNSANNNTSLVQDRAWGFIYGCQSFYKPSGAPDFARHGDISEEIFLQLTDVEKIQLFQLRGIMASALNAIIPIPLNMTIVTKVYDRLTE